MGDTIPIGLAEAVPDAARSALATQPQPSQPVVFPNGNPFEDACNLLNTVTRSIEDAISFLLTKWLHMRRLVDIIANLGFTIPFPDLSFLPNILTIDQQLYVALQRTCPALRLPPYGNESVEKLRSQVLAAYAALSRGLRIHPWNQLGGLQEQYSKLLGNVDSLVMSSGIGGGVINCIQSLCDGTASANIKAVIGGISVPDGFVKNYGDLLSAQERVLLSQMQEAKSSLAALVSAPS